MNLESKILDNLIYDSNYASKVIPFVKTEYFEKSEHSIVVDEIVKFYNKYNSTPTKDELKIELSNRPKMSDKMLEEVINVVDSIKKDNSDEAWIIEKTEEYFKERALTLAVLTSADILTGASKTKDKNQILMKVQEALAVSFDSNLGHDYFDHVEERYESYHRIEDKISWGIKSLDDITNGGISKKNLVCAVAPTGSGKSLFMCAIASNAIRQGLNVLYISMEMSEVRVAERIDANLMRDCIYNIHKLDLKQYTSKLENLKKRKHGRLIIKEYPTSGANTNHFKSLMNELKLKQGFVPDLVVVDYMNICSSSRVSPGQTNSYGYIKAISEELRGMAVEYNVAVMTATQTNRNGFNNSNIDITDTSESIGITYIMDFMFALIRTEALDENNEILVKQLKNRYGDLTKKPSFTLRINRDLMSITDVDAPPNPMDFEPERKVVPMVDVRTQGGFAYKEKAKPKSDFGNFVF